MNIRLHHKIALTINFFRALGVKDYNSVVAIVREGDEMNRTAYFRNGRWHHTLPPDAPHPPAELTMLEQIRRAWQACRGRG